MKPIVLLDCDGVLANFSKGYLEAFRNVTGLSYEESDVTEWDVMKSRFFQSAMDILGVSREDLRDLVNEHISLPGFCTSLEPYRDATPAVWELLHRASVCVVTSPWHNSTTWMYERTTWLWEHFRIPAKNVIHSSTKDLIYGDVFVDDKLDNVLAWGTRWPRGCPILFAQPYNDGHQGWDHVLEAVR